MHISEGVLSAPVLIGGAALALGGLAKGLKSLGENDIPRAAILAAVFFVASLIHINMGLTSIHLILSGLVGLFLGWAAFPVIFAGLLLQGILFQFGGLTVLGVNTFVIAFPAVLLGRALRTTIGGRDKRAAAVAAFVCGAGSVFLSSLLMTLALTLSELEFMLLATATLLSNLPLVLLEGLICALVVSFLAKVRPALLASEE